MNPKINRFGREQSKPRKVKNPADAINSLFKQKVGDKELESLIARLKKLNDDSINQGKVTYKLPEQP